MNSAERGLVIGDESVFFNNIMLCSVLRNEEHGGRLIDILKSKSSHHLKISG